MEGQPKPLTRSSLSQAVLPPGSSTSSLNSSGRRWPGAMGPPRASSTCIRVRGGNTMQYKNRYCKKGILPTKT
jgi:hypothetical protein